MATRVSIYLDEEQTRQLDELRTLGGEDRGVIAKELFLFALALIPPHRRKDFVSLTELLADAV